MFTDGSVPGKECDGGPGGGVSAGQDLRGGIGAVVDAARRFLDRAESSGEGAARRVHRLRVTTRRCEAVMTLAGDAVDPDVREKVQRALKKVRKAAGVVRDCDTQALLLEKSNERATRPDRDAVEYAIGRIEKERRAALRRLVKVADRRVMKGLKRLRKQAGTQGALQDAGALTQRVGVLIERVREAGARDLGILENVHALRVVLKELRYGVEGAGLYTGAGQGALDRFVQIQDVLGALNDAHGLVVRLERYQSEVCAGKAEPSSSSARGDGQEALCAGLKALGNHWKSVQEQLQRDAVERWHRSVRDGLLDLPGAGRAQKPSAVALVSGVGAGCDMDVGGVLENGASKGSTSSTNGARRTGPMRNRIAAIDVGTNSIRLIVAEVGADGAYRVMDDEKEVTRLGRCMHETGRIDRKAMEHTALTIARMKTIAEGYGAALLRAVGTCAAREAINGAEFADLVREISGLELRVVSAEEEAMLSYRSAARAFELRSIPGAVVDIGGGSTQVILSAARIGEGGESGSGNASHGGVVERVYTIPLGAVRLTSMAGGAERAAGEGFERMGAMVRRELKRRIGKPPIVPQLLIGTGGTLTTLAAMCVHAELGPAADGLFSGVVQGLEIRRPQVLHMIDSLRELSLRERSRVPGLSADRADIILAGLALVDGVMERLKVNSLRVHEGGIRDGILLEMAAEVVNGGSGAGRADPDPLRTVRRFARACGYEQAHSRHVAKLSLEIFDQLAEHSPESAPEIGPNGLFTARNRMLLEGAAILHDIGYLINYAAHHKHSYHLIVHADLPGLTTREVAVVANVARYHRLSEPKRDHPGYAKLSREDRRLVRALAGILRVADGLDRTHTQSVRAVDLRVEDACIVFGARCENECGVDIWGAERKASLFEKVFGLRTRFECNEAVPVVPVRDAAIAIAGTAVQPV